MQLTGKTSSVVENQTNYTVQTDDDLLCWRCGEPDSEHQWYGGKTYCSSAWVEDFPDVIFNHKQTFNPNPPEMSDEELVRRMTFVRDVRDWVL